MSETEPSEITELLHAVRDGRDGAQDRLIAIVYDDLRAMAAARMAHVPPSDTLQATALVHECYLRLVGRTDLEWRDRRSFFGIAARAMRDILVERARRHAAQKRGGGHVRVSLDAAEPVDEGRTVDLVALDEALTRLDAEDPRCAEVVLLRYFGGLSYEQAAEALGLPVSRIRREWKYAKAFLHRELAGGRGAAGG